VQAPVRLLLALRPSVAPALLIATAASTAVFIATPFLLPAVAAEYDISVGKAGLMSTTQLAGFVIASWTGGRFLRPTRSVFIAASLLGVVANLASAMAPTFEVLAAARLVSGLSLGLTAWFAWQAAFGDAGKTGDVAVVGPLVGTIVAPTVSLLIESIGIDGVFVVLAAVAGLPLLFVGKVSKQPQLRPHDTRHAATRAARVILLALGMITFGGSSVFVFGAAIGTGLNGMTALAVSLVYSANSVAAIPAARWFGHRGPAGVWFLGTAICAVVIGTSRSPVAFSAALISWGFVFFMGVPAVFALLASRSRFPEERAGDAQAVMALGRVFGPLLGGYFIASDAVEALGVVAAGIIVSAAILLLYVDRDRFIVRRQWMHRTIVPSSVDASVD
jgi:DHA1 family chloramphenicol resistance protein-like MFS transporter